MGMPPLIHYLLHGDCKDNEAEQQDGNSKEKQTDK
jgi:hypothetical protein